MPSECPNVENIHKSLLENHQAWEQSFLCLCGRHCSLLTQQLTELQFFSLGEQRALFEKKKQTNKHAFPLPGSTAGRV